MNQKAVKRIKKIKFLGWILLLNVVGMIGADEAALKNPDGSWKWTNRLIHETSPYLLLHAHNPVEWYPWGDEALERAKKENKLTDIYQSYHGGSNNEEIAGIAG